MGRFMFDREMTRTGVAGDWTWMNKAIANTFISLKLYEEFECYENTISFIAPLVHSIVPNSIELYTNKMYIYQRNAVNISPSLNNHNA